MTRTSITPGQVWLDTDGKRIQAHGGSILEVDGVFKSWAVTRGPSLDPKEKRLAVEVEDHPLDYGDFEGTIPKGQYGGGSVMLWDRGYWAPEPGFDIAKGLMKGELKFIMEGERVRGGWVLVQAPISAVAARQPASSTRLLARAIAWRARQRAVGGFGMGGSLCGSVRPGGQGHAQDTAAVRSRTIDA